MPIRLDKANGLPTYPQQKQQRSGLILEGQGQARLYQEEPRWLTHGVFPNRSQDDSRRMG